MMVLFCLLIVALIALQVVNLLATGSTYAELRRLRETLWAALVEDEPEDMEDTDDAGPENAVPMHGGEGRGDDA